jgi:PAS domain S-box-containing protein
MPKDENPLSLAITANLSPLFAGLLLQIARAAGTGTELSQLAETFVELTHKYFGVSAVGCWQLLGQELVGIAATGVQSERFRSYSLNVPGEAVVVDAVRSKKTLTMNHVAEGQGCAPDEHFHAASIMVTPLVVAGKVVGAVAYVHDTKSDYFSQEIADEAAVLATQLGGAIQTAQQLKISTEHQHRADELTSLALDLSSSIQLTELVKSITQRATSMMGAKSAALALMRGPFIETVFMLKGPNDPEHSLQRRLNLALSDFSVQHRSAVVWGAASDLISPGLAEAFGWQDLIIVRLMGSNQELIGLVCLANRGAELSEADHNLLQAILAHASIALDNSRLFSRISQANSQWIEIFDSISDFIVVHDQGSRVLRINRSFAEFVGARPADLVGASMKALMAIAQEPSAEPCPFCRSGANSNDEFIHPVLERTYLVSTSTIHASIHEGEHTIHVLKDISDRREAERRYRELFDNIQEGLFFSTPEGQFIEVNDALVRMLGYETREELLQLDVVSKLYSSPEQRQNFREAVECEGGVRNYEQALIKKDGSIVYTLQNAFAVRDSHGKVLQFRGLLLDITDLKNFQAELQRQRDFNLKILNNTQSLIIVCDTAGLVSYANRRCYETGGYKPGELVGKRLIEIVPPSHRDIALKAISQTLAGSQVDNLELPVFETDDRVGQFSINLSPMRDEQGQVTSMVVVMTDITDAALLQAKLMHTEKMAAVGQLVSGVAHEVNNPLTAILGFADLLSEQPEVPESAKRDLAIIIQEAQRTKVIVQNLLSFARQMPPQRQSVQINEIIRRTLQLRTYDIANHGIEVVQQLDDSIPEVIADPHQLQQVFLNILNNAYDSISDTGRPGRIEIFTRVNAGSVEIALADNGDGITAPERIFDPFYTTKEVGKGTGLGLSICYGIVREHGGEISCFNRTEPAGAVFLVRLPLSAAVEVDGAMKRVSA